MKRPAPSARQLHIGWIDLGVSALANAPPPANGYAFAVISPLTLDCLGATAWSDAISLSPCIVNRSYRPSVSAQATPPVCLAKEVDWPDTASVRSSAEVLIHARAVLDRTLNGFSGGTVLIDATAVSKSLLSSLVGMLIRTNSVVGIDIVYQKMAYLYEGKTLEAVYAAGPISHNINDIDFAFCAVPYVEGKYKPGLKRHVIVLCGLDFQRVLGKIRELEPAQINVIVETEAMIDPDSSKAFHKMCAQLGVETEDIAVADRSDVAMVNTLLAAQVERGRAHGLHPIIIAAGGKPFTLVAALQSVLASEAPLLTSIPDRVVELQVESAGPYQLFRLRDRSAIL